MSSVIEQFRQKSLGQQSSALGILVVSLVMVAAVERDIQRRPADQIRGRKSLWRLVSLNALGAAGYLRWGRRAAQS
jgi:hypothetical protein